MRSGDLAVARSEIGVTLGSGSSCARLLLHGGAASVYVLQGKKEELDGFSTPSRMMSSTVSSTRVHEEQHLVAGAAGALRRLDHKLLKEFVQ